jgi:hypothetical protein
MKATLFASILVAQVLAQAPPALAQSQAQASLDYEVFKTRVQPIFLNKRPGNARCVSCHTSGGAAYLQRLAPGQTTWDEEQSQKNFDRVKRLVVAGAPDKSRLLLHPLAVEAGGDDFHGGGKHFMTRDNPEWQVLAAWVKGQPPPAASSVQSRAGEGGPERPAPRTSGVRIVQTNSAGDAVSLIDPASNKVVAEIKNIEVNHGAAAAPDGSRSTSRTKPTARWTSSTARRCRSSNASRSAAIRTTCRFRRTASAPTSRSRRRPAPSTSSTPRRRRWRSRFRSKAPDTTPTSRRTASLSSRDRWRGSR